MKYIAASSETIPYNNNYFDVVTYFNSLDHVADIDKTIKEIKRVLRPGGLFLLLSDLNHPATHCEPNVFSCDIVHKFEPEFEILLERHYEKKPGEYTKAFLQGLIMIMMIPRTDTV